MPTTESSQSILDRVLNSVFFKNIMGKAPNILKNQHKLVNLIQAAFKKVNEHGVSNALSAAKENILMLIRMVRAYARGEYKDISTGSLLKVIGALVYFISPIDLVPDFLPIIGLTDDLALLAWVVSSLADEISKFKDWEFRQPIKI